LDGLVRRPSGVYVARLAVPLRLRGTVAKRELIASTGCRDLPLAKIVASEILAGWRRRLHDLDRLHAGMDLEQITVGHPSLSGGGFLPLAEAAGASGLDEDALLRACGDGRLGLHFRASRVRGYVVAFDALDRQPTPEGGGLIVPDRAHMPPSAVDSVESGILTVGLDAEDASDLAHALLRDGHIEVVMFRLPGRVGVGFVPDNVVTMTRYVVVKVVEGGRSRVVRRSDTRV
jgi:hypothetical protein